VIHIEETVDFAEEHMATLFGVEDVASPGLEEAACSMMTRRRNGT
jgi:hypothetical protein